MVQGTRHVVSYTFLVAVVRRSDDSSLWHRIDNKTDISEKIYERNGEKESEDRCRCNGAVCSAML